MEMRVELSCREDNHQKKYQAILLDGNIIVDNDNILPCCSANYLNFKSDLFKSLRKNFKWFS